MFDATEARRGFWRIATAGVLFQGAAAAIDNGTIVATLVYGLTGSAFGVGAAAAISRAGWLAPQLVVGYIAQRRALRMPLYSLGAFGRAACLAALAALLWFGAGLPRGWLIGLFFVLWTLFAFIGGIVAVPYNDIVARAVPSQRRSRLLAIRFFGGGLLALGVAAAAHAVLAALPFHAGHAALLLLAASLLLASALFFVSAREPRAPSGAAAEASFVKFLHAGLITLREDRRFRLFARAQWLGGAAAMALPFYILQASKTGEPAAVAATLLGAQTVGALLSNALWGWWGDRRGKLSLLGIVTLLGLVPPLLTLVWIATAAHGLEVAVLPWFVMVFAVLGAAGNGSTIAQLGCLMEISPDDRRPAYSGYFNAFIAPASLLPLIGALLVEAVSLAAVFAVSAFAMVLQMLVIKRLENARAWSDDR